MSIEEIGFPRNALSDIWARGTLAIQSPMQRERGDPRRSSPQHANADLGQTRNNVRLPHHHAHWKRTGATFEYDVRIS